MSCPSESEVSAALEVLVRGVRADVLAALAEGNLAAIAAAGQQAQHLIGLVGLRRAEAAFLTAGPAS